MFSYVTHEAVPMGLAHIVLFRSAPFAGDFPDDKFTPMLVPFRFSQALELVFCAQ
jgi:hypothetical protein